jgi:microcystin-dependent protein
LAEDAQKNTIPDTTGSTTGLFSQQYGWQSINALPLQAGGKAVKREDFNGVFNLLGGVAFMAQKGFTFNWDSTQDYYVGCVVIDATDGLRYECIADVTANSTAPSADTTHWQIFKAGTDIDYWFRQKSTVYTAGDLRCTESLPYGWYLECTVAGTTDSGDITLPSPVVENAIVVDGTVTWKIRKIGSGGGEAIGVIKAFAGNGDIPAGYLLCDGSAVSRTMFPDLFSAIGTTYGAGDGSTTFNVPDYNTAARFAQGGTVAGVEKSAGLPNITGGSPNVGVMNTVGGSQTGAFSDTQYGTGFQLGNANVGTAFGQKTITLDASRSNPIYGNSDTVQPDALTTRFIIKAFDGQTPDSALIDITQYAQELAGKANITGSNLVHHRDVITTSGTYTAPVTGLYKITVKGGGGGGAGGYASGTSYYHASGGGEGGTTIAYELMTAGQTASVVIGAGGAGGGLGARGASGGDSSITVNGNSYAGGGGEGGYADNEVSGGCGGAGTIYGAAGGTGHGNYGNIVNGCSGGGEGGGTPWKTVNGAQVTNKNGVNGGGGAGGTSSSSSTAGGNGGDGYAWLEYFTPGV